jgi:transposase
VAAPLTEAQCIEAVACYRSGASVRAVAKTFEVSYGTMHRVLTEAGVEMRGRSGK